MSVVRQRESCQEMALRGDGRWGLQGLRKSCCKQRSNAGIIDTCVRQSQLGSAQETDLQDTAAEYLRDAMCNSTNNAGNEMLSTPTASKGASIIVMQALAMAR